VRNLDPFVIAGFLGAAASIVTAQPREIYPYPDDSILARDALPRVLELSTAGNGAEAVRVLQSVLESDGEKVMPGTQDQLYVPVRQMAHALLTANPELLERYRVTYSARAQSLVDAGKLREAERAYFMTAPGLEATLRLAQMELESARFESSRLLLESLAAHPDAGSSRGEIARLAGVLARYLSRPAVQAWAEGLREQAGLAEEIGPPVAWPAHLVTVATGPLTPQRRLNLDEPLAAKPLQRAMIEDFSLISSEPGAALMLDFRQQASQDGRVPWIFPAVRGDWMYVNDGLSIGALDPATLAPIWRTRPAGRSVPVVTDTNLAMGNWKGLEDVAGVTVAGRLVLAVTGTPSAGTRTGDRRVHALDAESGRVIWSVDTARLDPVLRETSVRGPIVVDGDTVVVSARRPSGSNRTIGLYLIGLGLHDGAHRWTRHLGSIGSVTWARQQSHPEGAAASRGVVFRTDDMGLLGAVEAATGRARWVRLFSVGRNLEGVFAGPELPPPYEINLPIVDEDTVIALDPSGTVARYEAATGRVLESRRFTEARTADTPYTPKYMVRVGDWLAVMSAARLFVLPMKDIAKGELRLGPAFGGEYKVAGRAVACGEELLVPVTGGLLRVDVARPQAPSMIPLGTVGNVVVGGDSSGSHVVIVDGSQMHTYLRWPEAQELLVRRMQAKPKDARSALTMLELASRSARNDLIPELADRILGIAQEQSTQQGEKVRSHLFDLLLSVIGSSEPGRTFPGRRAFADLTPITDSGLLDEVIDRLGRAGESAQERVLHNLELASLRESQERLADAVEALQGILLDDEMATSSFARLEGGSNGSTVAAADEAAARLTTLVRRAGPQSYAIFDSEADAEFERLGEGAEVEELVRAARRYPLASRAPDLWHRAAERLLKSEQPTRAREALGRGLEAAETSIAIGRENHQERFVQLADALLDLGIAQGQRESAARLLQRLTTLYPEVIASGQRSWKSEREAMTSALSKRTARPSVQDTVSERVQVIGGWTPLSQLLPDAAGRSGDCVAMLNEVKSTVGVWGVELATDQLSLLWERDYGKARPTVIHVGHAVTLLFWPGAGNGEVECVSTLTGERVWRTSSIDSLLEDGPQVSGSMRAPLENEVNSDDLLVQMVGDSLILMQRSGRSASLAISSGEARWKRNLPLRQVYEMCAVGDWLVVGGTAPRDGNAGTKPALISMNLADGKFGPASEDVELGDHVRWMRAAGDHEVILAVSDAVIRLDLSTGRTVWRSAGEAAAMTGSGWMTPKTLFISDNQSRVWAVNAATGAIEANPCDMRNKLSYPFAGHSLGDRVIFLSASGVVLLGDKGELRGTDIVNSQGRLAAPVLTADRVVMVESYEDRIREDGEAESADIRLFMLDLDSARMLSTAVLTIPGQSVDVLQVLDGRIVLSVDAATLVYSTRPKGE
jgi:outer membrane protein assembly factor BamB